MGYVIRSRYCQPDGIGWVTKDGAVSHNPSQAQVFTCEDDAWVYLTANHEQLMGRDERGDFSWPEEAREYTREERETIIDEYQAKRDAYYKKPEEN